MQHLRRDFERYYLQRSRLFEERWAYGAREYARRAAELETTIREYEKLVCRGLSKSLPGIFPPSETAVE